MADMAGFPVPPGSYMRETLFALTRMGLQGLLRSKEEANKHAQDLNAIIPHSAPNRVKVRGLYVDMGSEGLSTPSEIGVEGVRFAGNGLSWSLETFADLPRLLGDDHQWCPFVRDVRQRFSRLL